MHLPQNAQAVPASAACTPLCCRHPRQGPQTTLLQRTRAAWLARRPCYRLSMLRAVAATCSSRQQRHSWQRTGSASGFEPSSGVRTGLLPSSGAPCPHGQPRPRLWCLMVGHAASLCLCQLQHPSPARPAGHALLWTHTSRMQYRVRLCSAEAETTCTHRALLLVNNCHTTLNHHGCTGGLSQAAC